MMNPVDGHPFVFCRVDSTLYGHIIDCACSLCRHGWQKECKYPQRIPVWVNRFCIDHCHGNNQLREEFKKRYHLSLINQRD